MYKIREANEGDYLSFFLLYQESRKKADPEGTVSVLDEERYNKIITDPSVHLYVVENNKELQAFTLFYGKKLFSLLQPVEKEILYVEELYVKASEERKGLKLYLYEKIERYAKRNGIKRIEVSLPADEEEKIAYYEERFRLKSEYVVLVSDL